MLFTKNNSISNTGKIEQTIKKALLELEKSNGSLLVTFFFLLLNLYCRLDEKAL